MKIFNLNIYGQKVDWKFEVNPSQRAKTVSTVLRGQHLSNTLWALARLQSYQRPLVRDPKRPRAHGHSGCVPRVRAARACRVRRAAEVDAISQQALRKLPILTAQERRRPLVPSAPAERRPKGSGRGCWGDLTRKAARAMGLGCLGEVWPLGGA